LPYFGFLHKIITVTDTESTHSVTHHIMSKVEQVTWCSVWPAVCDGRTGRRWL